MKTETITLLRPCDFEKLEEFINYYLFGQVELPKLNPYKEYLLCDLLLEFLANYSEEIKIVRDAEKLYLTKVFNLFNSNSDAYILENLNECYNKSHVKKKISHFSSIIENKINITHEIFTKGKEQEVYDGLTNNNEINLEILTFLIYQLEGILAYVPERSCSIPSEQYQKILDHFLIDHHHRSSIFEAFKGDINEN